MPNLSCARPVVIFSCVPAFDVGIDPQRDSGGVIHGGGDRREHLQLFDTFHIDLGDALGQCDPKLVLGLAHAGEDDAPGWDAGQARTAQFALTHNVGARALRRQ